MTSINVAKGLFRVWVLFALCWVLSVGVVLKNEFNSESTISGIMPPCKPQGRLVFDKCDPWERDWNNVQMPPEGAVIGDDGKFWTLRKPDWSLRMTAVMLVFGVPLLLLLFGCGVLWAVRGFKE